MVIRAKPKKYPLKSSYRGTTYEWVDKTASELRGEYNKFLEAITHANKLLKPLRRSPSPVILAVHTHLNTITPLTSFETSEELAKEIVRLNLSFIEAVRMLATLKNTTIPTLELLRFHLTYSCTHKKRDLSSGWNKGKSSSRTVDTDDEDHELDQE